VALRPRSTHFTLERLASGVHAAIATSTGFGLCNSTVIDLGGQTVVFDSMLTPMAGSQLNRAAARLTGRSPAWVVNSHWHGDHIWGNGNFVGAHVVSTRRTREVILRRSREQFKDNRRHFPQELAAIESSGSPIAAQDRPQVRAWFQGVLKTPQPFRIVPPDVTFREELVLEGPKRSLHLLSYGGGHSPSDVLGYLPEDGLLLGGDLLLVDYHPSVGDGWPDRWIRILHQVERLRPDRVVPGHGPVGPRTTIRTNLDYLSDLQRGAVRAVNAGSTLKEFLETPMPRRARRWGFSFMFPDNLVRAYRLARAGRGKA
jgi:cyclase